MYIDNYERQMTEATPAQSKDRYEYHLGNTVYLGANEYEILSFDDDRVMLYDLQYPLFNKETWVSKDEFRWYLRSGDNSSDEFNPDEHIKIASFTLTIEDAKKYLYSFSTRRRVYNWRDLNVSIWI